MNNKIHFIILETSNSLAADQVECLQTRFPGPICYNRVNSRNCLTRLWFHSVDEEQKDLNVRQQKRRSLGYFNALMLATREFRRLLRYSTSMGRTTGLMFTLWLLDNLYAVNNLINHLLGTEYLEKYFHCEDSSRHVTGVLLFSANGEKEEKKTPDRRLMYFFR